MRTEFINIFHRDPAIAEMTGGGDPDWVNTVDTLSGDVVGILGALNGTKTTVVRNSGGGSSTTTGYSTSNGTTSSNTIIYVLLAVAAIGCIFLFLKK